MRATTATDLPTRAAKVARAEFNPDEYLEPPAPVASPTPHAPQ